METHLRNTYCSYVNLWHRKDRRDHMTDQLERVGLEAERTRGMLPDEFIHNPDFDQKKIQVMKNRTPGAIGCHYSQVSIMEKALALNKNAFVLEDDVVFCDDFQKRFAYIDEWMSRNDWDVFWLGGTFHSPAHWHSQPHNRELPLCRCSIGKDCEPTDDPRIMRTYGAFCTYAYIVNINSLERILSLLDNSVHISMGIDWLFILLQPHLKTYAFVPGCIKQMDNQSDIGNGITYFSGFAESVGPWWYQENMEDFEPLNYNWQ